MLSTFALMFSSLAPMNLVPQHTLAKYRPARSTVVQIGTLPALNTERIRPEVESEIARVRIHRARAHSSNDPEPLFWYQHVHFSTS